MNQVLLTILISFIAFLGQVIGELLARISPEEMKPGRKYFSFFEIFFIFVICILGLVLFPINIWLLLLGIVFGLIFKKTYSYFGGLLFGLTSNYLFLFSTLVFIYGLFYGTLNGSFKDIRKLVFDLLLFFAAGAVVLFVKFDLSSVFIGALITQLLFLCLKIRKSNT